MRTAQLIKLLLFVPLLLCISSPTVSARALQPLGNQKLKKALGKAPIMISEYGKQRHDGLYTPARFRPYQKPQPGSYLPGVVVVKTKALYPVVDNGNALQGSSLNAFLKPYGIQSIRQPFYTDAPALQSIPDIAGIRRIYEIRYAVEVDPWDLCQQLAQHPEIEYAEPLYIRELLYTPNDPIYVQQQALQRISADKAWDITKGSTQVTIAILDSGTDWEHEDLRDNIWTNPNEIPDNGIDDDGNGKIDDIHGWDFVGNVSAAEIQQGIFREDNDPKVRTIVPPGTNDTRSHGTNVAGNASAVTDNQKGIASIGFQCSLIPVKLSSDQQVGGIFRGYEAILYAAQLGADVINLSWGSPSYASYEQDVINQATAMGSLIVAASGNSSMFTDVNVGYYPAQYENVLNVGASDQSDNFASFSHYGTGVHVYAPGVANWSTMPGNSYLSNPNWSGTSFAAPIVSGIAALVKTLHPDWTPRQIFHQIRSTVDNVFSQVQQNPALRPFLYGRVNAYKAVAYNQSFLSGDRIPGVEITAIGLSSPGGVISSYDPVQVRLTVKNFLAPTDQLTLTLASFDGFAMLPAQPINIGRLGTLDSQNVDITLQLSPYNGWFSGTIDILAAFQDGDYVDYQRIEIPVAIQSPHTYTIVPLSQQLAATLTHVQYFDAVAPSLSSFWAVGYLAGAGAVYVNASSTQVLSLGLGIFTNFSQNPAFAVAALSPQIAWISTNSDQGGNAQIWRTTNGGQSWATVSVSSITDFINALHFTDNLNGIFLGDPKNGRWGIGRTTDGGATWSLVTGLPAPQPNETGLVGSRFFMGNRIWFGTTQGRVFYSTNGGSTWNVSTIDPTAMVLHLSFTTATNGIAIYRQGSGSFAEDFVARTTDGGQSWTKLSSVRLTQMGIDPVMVFAPENSRLHYLVDAFGRVWATPDNGTTWEVRLTRELTVTRMAALSWNTSLVNIWNIGPRGLGYLSLPYEAIPKAKLLEAEFSILDFDTVTIGNEAVKFVRFSNTGEEHVSIQGITITSQSAEPSEFEVINSLPATIAPGESKTLGIRFRPSQTGERTAVLEVSSDADNAPTRVTLRGYGKIVSSVGEQFSAITITVHGPSPYSELHIRASQPLPSLDLHIFSIDGRALYRKHLDGSATGEWRLPLHGFASGTYIVQILRNGKTIYSSLCSIP